MLQVKNFREQHGISQRDAVNVIREQFAGFDKYLLSKVENPDKYGVRLVNSAEQALVDAYSTTAINARKPDKRRKPKRVQCRMSEKLYNRLQQALNKAGYDTMQDGLEAIINEWLGGR